MSLGEMFVAALQGVLMLGMALAIMAAIAFVGWVLFWGIPLVLILIVDAIKFVAGRIGKIWSRP